MSPHAERGEFPELTDENLTIWDTNAEWWDDRIGDGNDFQDLLIAPATERLLELSPGDVVLDIACGAGRFTRRMAELGARVVAIDHSPEFIGRARERSTSADHDVEYHVLDAADEEQLLALGAGRFDKAVCTMALMDMPQIEPLMAALPRLLRPQGSFVFSITHPCFHSARIQRFCEMYEQEDGRHTVHAGVKVSAYLKPFARKTEGILGQPRPQYYFHRPIEMLLDLGFRAEFVLDGLEEPGLGREPPPRAGLSWDHMPDIPPIMVVRLRKGG